MRSIHKQAVMKRSGLSDQNLSENIDQLRTDLFVIVDLVLVWSTWSINNLFVSAAS